LAYVANPNWPVEYRTLYVALLGEIFSTEPVGHTADRVILKPVETPSGLTYRGEPSSFVVGMERSLALTVDLQGNLLAADSATGLICRVTYLDE
jgi:hypothetical protein